MSADSVGSAVRPVPGAVFGQCAEACCVVVLVVNHCGQTHKGVWGMSWRQKAMKGVEDCEKPGEAVKRALIPGSLNYRLLNS